MGLFFAEWDELGCSLFFPLTLTLTLCGTPTTRFPDGCKVEGQSGQHRVAALRQYMNDTDASSDEDWWIVRLMENGSRILSMTLYAPNCRF
jgi:hypothetical protein